MKLSPLVLVTGFTTIILLGAGCSMASRLTGTNGVIQSQTPGQSSGAGATLLGPANAAAPSTQVAERRTAYYPPQSAAKQTVPIASPIPTRIDAPTQIVAPVIVAQPPTTEPVYPAWTYEKVTTSIGQHQDAAGLVKAAQTASGWSWVRWFGLIVMVIGIGGWLYSYNNKETGYPLVFIKVFLCGAIITAVGSNPWLLLLLLIPVGFYAFQKLTAAGILHLPPLP